MNFAIIGCGLIGQKRVRALRPQHRILYTVDVKEERARKLAEQADSKPLSDWRVAVSDPNVDAVIIATVNHALAPITLGAVENGKHVLVEKPAAIRAEELDPIIALAHQKRVCVQTGFNHRFHPALQKAKAIVDSGEIGPLMFLRGRYGHGGRVGYDKEWRANPELSGGGELIDQGVHLIDLSRWFLGDFTTVEGHAHTYFWDMAVDDNAFLSLRTAAGQTAWIHASCTEWKNLFSLEIYGRTGKLQVDGLGGSYGVERIAFYKMLPEMGPPPTTIWEFPGEDISWRTELALFFEGIQRGAAAGPSLEDARAALAIVAQIYKGFQA